MSEFHYTGPGYYRRRDSGKAWVGCDLRDGGCNSSYPLLGIVVGGIGIRSWTDTGATSVKCTPHDYDLIGPWVEPEPDPDCCNINPDCVTIVAIDDQPRWRKEPPDCEGLWAVMPREGKTPSVLWVMEQYVEEFKTLVCGKYAYLRPLPTILEPEPELRLPEGWRDESVQYGRCLDWHIEASSGMRGGSHSFVAIEHPDKATAIAAAQAAVDVLAKGGDI